MCALLFIWAMFSYELFRQCLSCKTADNVFDEFIDLVYSVFAFIHLLQGGIWLNRSFLKDRNLVKLPRSFLCLCLC